MSARSTSSPVSSSTIFTRSRLCVALLSWLSRMRLDSEVAGESVPGHETRDRRKYPRQSVAMSKTPPADQTANVAPSGLFRQKRPRPGEERGLVAALAIREGGMPGLGTLSAIARPEEPRQ